MSSVELQRVTKLFGDQPVVSDLSLKIEDGEFLVLVGPSGCGKTTTLRMLAGLQHPSYGKIFIGAKDVTTVPPGARDIGMVFQSYALYPNKSVYGNLAFGPRVRREEKKTIESRILEVSATLGITELLRRKPNELSGGQRQRVALGRALIRQPQLFLLDEPLSNLDAALRSQMRTELIKLHNLLKVTTVLVTHDQVEALTMGDRVAVMDLGNLQQVGDPATLYDNPANLFVATFLGSPKINVMPVPGSISSTATFVPALGVAIDLVEFASSLSTQVSNEGVTLGLRPHDIYMEGNAPPGASVRFQAEVVVVEHAGSEIFAIVTTSGGHLSVRFPRNVFVARGDKLTLRFDPNDLYAFDTETELSIRDRSKWVSRSATSSRDAIDSGLKRMNLEKEG